jgi:hypothetical protein
MVSVLTPIATEIFFILSFENAVKQNKKIAVKSGKMDNKKAQHFRFK